VQVNVVLHRPAPEGRVQGIVEQVKENFGFIDAFGDQVALRVGPCLKI
jgi:hypothetical protein